MCKCPVPRYCWRVEPTYRAIGGQGRPYGCGSVGDDVNALQFVSCEAMAGLARRPPHRTLKVTVSRLMVSMKSGFVFVVINCSFNSGLQNLRGRP